METNFEVARHAIPAPERVRSRAQQRAAFPDMRLGKACCAREQARSRADLKMELLENVAWIVVAICSALILIMSF